VTGCFPLLPTVPVILTIVVSFTMSEFLLNIAQSLTSSAVLDFHSCGD
jgi:hypothetical protein